MESEEPKRIKRGRPKKVIIEPVITEQCTEIKHIPRGRPRTVDITDFREYQKTYYEKNKEQIALKQKEYRDTIKTPSYKNKLLRKLNTDEKYLSKTSQDILTKYNIIARINSIHILLVFCSINNYIYITFL